MSGNFEQLFFLPAFPFLPGNSQQRVITQGDDVIPAPGLGDTFWANEGGWDTERVWGEGRAAHSHMDTGTGLELLTSFLKETQAVVGRDPL